MGKIELEKTSQFFFAEPKICLSCALRLLNSPPAGIRGKPLMYPEKT